MRVLIPTIGTRGDVQPYIALAAALNRLAFTPPFATHPAMRTLIDRMAYALSPSDQTLTSAGNCPHSRTVAKLAAGIHGA